MATSSMESTYYVVFTRDTHTQCRPRARAFSRCGLGAASPTQLLEKLRLREWAFRRRLSLYKTQFQGPVIAAAGEQSCLKLTFVSLAIDPRTVRLQRSDLCSNRGYTNSNRVGAVVSLPG